MVCGLISITIQYDLLTLYVILNISPYFSQQQFVSFFKNKFRQSFYGLNSLGMSYPGAAPEVQAYLYKSICQPVLTYSMECISNSKDQFRRMESSLDLSKRSHNSAVLKALNAGLYRIWCGVNRLGDSGVHTLSNISAFVNPAGQLKIVNPTG